MNSMDDPELKKHLEEVQELDDDLFDEKFYEEDPTFELDEKSNRVKGKPRWKPISLLVAFTLVLGVIGPIATTFNPTTIEFLKKSYVLSQDEEIKEYKKAIVTIKSENRKGTGFNISKNGLVITNYHIVEDNKEAIIHFSDGPVVSGKIIESLPEKDLAILKVREKSPLPYLEVARTRTWQKGEHIYFIGNPLMFHQIANEGFIVGEWDTLEESVQSIIIDAPIYSGNSGSPVINQSGVVVAVIYAKTKANINGAKKEVGLAVPIHLLKDEIENHWEN